MENSASGVPAGLARTPAVTAAATKAVVRKIMMSKGKFFSRKALLKGVFFYRAKIICLRNAKTKLVNSLYRYIYFCTLL